MLTSQAHRKEVGSQRLQLLVKGALQHPVQPLSATARPQQDASSLERPAGYLNGLDGLLTTVSLPLEVASRQWEEQAGGPVQALGHIVCPHQILLSDSHPIQLLVTSILIQYQLCPQPHISIPNGTLQNETGKGAQAWAGAEHHPVSSARSLPDPWPCRKSEGCAAAHQQLP